MIGAVLVVAMTAMTVTMAVLFNLISDLLGGVRVTVLEEEVVLRRAPTAVARSGASAAARGRRHQRRLTAYRLFAT